MGWWIEQEIRAVEKLSPKERWNSIPAAAFLIGSNWNPNATILSHIEPIPEIFLLFKTHSAVKNLIFVLTTSFMRENLMLHKVRFFSLWINQCELRNDEIHFNILSHWQIVWLVGWRAHTCRSTESVLIFANGLNRQNILTGCALSWEFPK